MMKKKYIIMINIAILCFVFFLSFILSGNQKKVTVQSIADIPKKVKIRFSSSWGGL